MLKRPLNHAKNTSDTKKELKIISQKSLTRNKSA
jgi:PAB1-binding protein PBP1